MKNYKVMPEVPTDEMIKAVFTSDKEWGNDYAPPKSDCIAVYKAMYAAAPITKQDLIDDYNNNHKPQVEYEPVARIVFDRRNNEKGVCSHKERPQIWPLVGDKELLKYEYGTPLYTIPQDQSKRIDELEAKNAKLIEALDYALSECKMLGKDIRNFGMDYFYDEVFENELKLLDEMKKGK